MDARAHFEGKRITVMGLGILGRGVGDARFLAECGADLIVTDLKSKDLLAESVSALATFPNITFVLGEHRYEDFRNRDFILKAAGVPLDSPYIKEARDNGIPVKMSASWFAEHAGIPVIGVTGTRGKSTVTHMLAAILSASGKPFVLGGNIQGVSTLSLLPEVTENHVALFELDSWQLQGFGEDDRSPSISIFTTFLPDHLNYYPSLERYLEDKAHIFLHQKETDTLILGEQCAPIIEETYKARIRSRVLKVGEDMLPDAWTLRIPGVHNRYAAALALAAARTLSIPDEVSQEALESFGGVPGRLELIRTLGGVDFYNDTTATTPDATRVALEALRNEGKRILLIAGGADKGLVMDALIDDIRVHNTPLFLLSGTGTSRIQGQVPDAPIYDSLEEAVHAARAQASSGDVVLFSPAFASFGMFKNEYDRGEVYRRIVEAL